MLEFQGPTGPQFASICSPTVSLCSTSLSFHSQPICCFIHNLFVCSNLFQSPLFFLSSTFFRPNLFYLSPTFFPSPRLFNTQLCFALHNFPSLFSVPTLFPSPPLPIPILFLFLPFMGTENTWGQKILGDGKFLGDRKILGDGHTHQRTNEWTKYLQLYNA